MKLLLHPIPPFELARTVWVLRRREHNLVDRWDGRVWRRVMVLGKRVVEVSARQAGSGGRPVLEVSVPGRLSAGAEAQLRGALACLLGVHADLRGFYRMAARHPALDEMARRFIGLKPPRFPSLFETLANGIACQQISLDAGISLLNRVACAFGRKLAGQCAFPGPEEIAGVKEIELRRLGFSGARSRALLELAALLLERDHPLADLHDLDDASAIERLEQLRGVGRWTAEYVLLRGLGRLHVFPGDDVGARRRLERWLALPRPLDYAGVRDVTAPWQPWAGLVYFHLLLRGLAERGVPL